MGKLTDAITKNDIEGVTALLEGEYRGSLLINEEVGPGGEQRPLHMAALCGRIEILELLLKAGAKINQPDKQGRTAVHAAIQGGHGKKVLQVLVNAKADLNRPMRGGDTALMMATRNQTDALQILVDAKADINKSKEDGCTAIYLATEYDNTAGVRILVDAKADIDPSLTQGVTPFFEAALKGNETIARILMDAKADINKPKEGGFRPVHMAAQGGHEGILKILLAKRADVTAKTEKGHTALELANSNGQTDIAELLEAHLSTTEDMASSPIELASPLADPQPSQGLSPKDDKPHEPFEDEKSASELDALAVLTAQAQALENSLKKELSNQEVELLSLKQAQQKLEDEIKTLQATPDQKSSAEQLTVQTKVEGLQQQLTALEIQHAVLWNAYEIKQQRHEALKRFQKHPNFLIFYRTIQIRLEAIFVSFKAVAGGSVDPAAGKLGMIKSMVDIMGDVVSIAPIIGTAIDKILKWTSGSLGKIDSARQTNIAINASERVTLSELQKYAESVARQLTDRYAEQLLALTTPEQEKAQLSKVQQGLNKAKILAVKSKPSSSAKQLAVFGIAWMLDALHEAHTFDEQQPLDVILISTICEKKPAPKLKEFWNTVTTKLNIKGLSNQTEKPWHPEDVYTLPGIKTDKGEYYTSSVVHPEIYGWRLGTFPEAQSLGLKPTAAPIQVESTLENQAGMHSTHLQQILELSAIIKQQGTVLEKLEKTGQIAGAAYIKEILQQERETIKAELKAELFEELRAELLELFGGSPPTAMLSNAPTQNFLPLNQARISRRADLNSEVHDTTTESKVAFGKKY